MKANTFVLFTAFLLILSGCSMHSQKPDQLAGVDIEDAVYIGVDDPDHAKNQDNNLVKLTSSDFSEDPEPLLFKDDGGGFFGDPPLISHYRYYKVIVLPN